MKDFSSTAEVARKVRSALDASDLDAFAELLDPDVYWGPPGDDRSGCHNRSEVIDWYGRARGRGMRGRVVELVAGEGAVLVGIAVRGTPAARDRGGQLLRWQVLKLRDGKVVEIRGYERRDEAAASAKVAPE